jgi:hypothetical protein
MIRCIDDAFHTAYSTLLVQSVDPDAPENSKLLYEMTRALREEREREREREHCSEGSLSSAETLR